MSMRTGATVAADREGDEILLAFTGALRAGGVAVTQDRAHDFLEAAALLGVDEPAAVRVAGRSTLCAGPDDLARFDQVFEAFFDARHGLPRPRPAVAQSSAESSVSPLPLDDGDGGDPGEHADELVRAAAIVKEVGRH